jgi:hypothetical protein
MQLKRLFVEEAHRGRLVDVDKTLIETREVLVVGSPLESRPHIVDLLEATELGASSNIPDNDSLRILRVVILSYGGAESHKILLVGGEGGHGDTVVTEALELAHVLATPKNNTGFVCSNQEGTVGRPLGIHVGPVSTTNLEARLTSTHTSSINLCLLLVAHNKLITALGLEKPVVKVVKGLERGISRLLVLLRGGLSKLEIFIFVDLEDVFLIETVVVKFIGCLEGISNLRILDEAETMALLLVEEGHEHVGHLTIVTKNLPQNACEFALLALGDDWNAIYNDHVVVGGLSLHWGEALLLFTRKDIVNV